MDFVGDIVGIFLNTAASLLEKDEVCSGIVSCTTASSIDVALDIDVENADVSEEEIYKVCKLSNNVTFRRLKGYVKLLNACLVSAIVFYHHWNLLED